MGKQGFTTVEFGQGEETRYMSFAAFLEDRARASGEVNFDDKIDPYGPGNPERFA